MKIHASVLIVLAFGAGLSLRAEEVEVVVQPAGVTVVSVGGAERIDVLLPGRLIQHASPKQGDGSRSVMLLVGDVIPPVTDGELPPEVPPCKRDVPGAPRSIWQLIEPFGEPTLELVRDDVPADSAGLLARDLDGDGTDELLIVRPGELLLVPQTAGGEPSLLLSDPGLGRWSVGAWSGKSDWLPVAAVGGTRFLRTDSMGEAWDEVSVELPIHARNRRTSLVVSSLEALLVGQDLEGNFVYATPPEPFGDRRLRSFVIRPEATSAEGRIEESWGQLPAPERVFGWEYRMLDGEPVMLVRTTPADRVNLFGELLVRLFPLRRDRSRTGHLPLAAFKSRINLLQSGSVNVTLRDVDGDERADLVLTALQGFEGDKIVMDAYTRKTDGSFRGSAKTTAVKIKSEQATRVEFGRDFNLDGRPDLQVSAEEQVHIFPGLATGKKRLVADKPLYSVPMPEFGLNQAANEITISRQGPQGFSRVGERRAPRTVDLDGDGVAELLVTGVLADGRGAISVMRLVAADP